MASSPEKKADDREIGTAQAARDLGVSIATIYRYVDAGDLHPRNVLPRQRRGRRQHTYRFSRAEVAELKRRQKD